MMPPNFRAVFFSSFMSGVPVKPMKHALGSAFIMRRLASPYWER